MHDGILAVTTSEMMTPSLQTIQALSPGVFSSIACVSSTFSVSVMCSNSVSTLFKLVLVVMHMCAHDFFGKS